jgi:hypothetical protein
MQAHGLREGAQRRAGAKAVSDDKAAALQAAAGL